MLPSRYTQPELIGSGAFGRVYKAYDSDTHQEVAIKSIALSSLSRTAESLLMREISTLRGLQSPYIVALHGVEQTASSCCIVMELCRGQTLEGYLQGLRAPVAEDAVRQWAKQLVAGLAEMRAKHVIHRDLKLANVMLSSANPAEATVKICDFGFSRILHDDEMAETVLGTPYFSAPEVLQGLPYNHKADVWSLGCILFELLLARKPFPATSFLGLLEMQQKPVVLEDAEISPCAKALLMDLLEVDPDRRPDVTTLLAHPFFQHWTQPTIDMEKGSIQEIEKNADKLLSLGLEYEQSDPEVAHALLECCVHSVRSMRQKVLRALHLLPSCNQCAAISPAVEEVSAKASVALARVKHAAKGNALRKAEGLLVAAIRQSICSEENISKIETMLSAVGDCSEKVMYYSFLCKQLKK